MWNVGGGHEFVCVHACMCVCVCVMCMLGMFNSPPNEPENTQVEEEVERCEGEEEEMQDDEGGKRKDECWIADLQSVMLKLTSTKQIQIERKDMFI